MQREDVLQPIETEGRGRLPPEAGCVQSLMAHASGDRTRRSPTPLYLGESPATICRVVSWLRGMVVRRRPNTGPNTQSIEDDSPHQQCTCSLATRRTSSIPRGQGCP